jgi:hypothetical protein
MRRCGKSGRQEAGDLARHLGCVGGIRHSGVGDRDDDLRIERARIVVGCALEPHGLLHDANPEIIRPVA